WPGRRWRRSTMWPPCMWSPRASPRRWSTGDTGEEPAEGAARRAVLEPGGPGLPPRRLAPERQRHRDRQVRSQLAAGVPDRQALRSADRGDLRRDRRMTLMALAGSLSFAARP